LAIALLRDHEASQWWPPEQIAIAQARRLRRFLVEVGRHHPALHDRFVAAGFRPELVASAGSLAGLPPVDPPDIDGEGGPEADCEAWQQAARWRARGWWGVEPGDPLLGLASDGEGLDTNLDLLRGRRPPRAVVADGETLVRLARRTAERRLTPTEVPLRALFTSVAALDAAACAEVEAHLGAPIAFYLDLPDFGTIAHTCPEGGLHLCGGHLVVEVVKPTTGRPVKVGTTGEVVVTDTTRRKYPQVRCHTAIRARLMTEPCLCGRGLPLIEMAPL